MRKQASLSRRQLIERAFAGGAALLGMPIDARAAFPTGRQLQIAGHNQRLVVTEVGATLRSYQAAGREVLWGFAETELPRDSQGQLLLPWPGRCEGGAYTFQGKSYQLAITNVGANVAQHGLVRSMNCTSQHFRRCGAVMTRGIHRCGTIPAMNRP